MSPATARAQPWRVGYLPGLGPARCRRSIAGFCFLLGDRPDQVAGLAIDQPCDDDLGEPEHEGVGQYLLLRVELGQSRDESTMGQQDAGNCCQRS